MAGLEVKRTEQLAAAIGVVRHIIVEEEIAGLSGQDGGILVLLPGVRIFSVPFWQCRVDADGRYHQVSTRERRTELLITSQVGNGCSEVAAC